MKYRFLIKCFLVFPALMLLTGFESCTHNNGNIGEWFGTWTLTSITVDGEKGDDYFENSTWSFQNRVIKIQEEFSHNTYSDHYGTWEQEGNEFSLDFNHYDSKDTLVWSRLYKFPTNMYFGMDKGVANMHIDNMSGSKVDLRYLNPQGQTIIYHLKKLY